MTPEDRVAAVSNDAGLAEILTGIGNPP